MRWLDDLELHDASIVFDNNLMSAIADHPPEPDAETRYGDRAATQG